MGLLNILGVLAAVVSVSALAADPPVPRGNVSVNVNPTTSYYTVTNSTLRLPNGVSVSPSATTPPVVSKYSGGLQQSIPTGITIEAIKKSAPLPAVVRSTTNSLKGAATRCLTSARCNVGLILAGEGLNRLFDGLDWVMGEGGKIQKITNDYTIDSPPAEPFWQVGTECRDYIPTGGVQVGDCTGSARPLRVCRPAQVGTINVFAGYDGNFCYWVRRGAPAPDFSKPVTLSDSEIEAGVSDNYDPEPSDWPALTPELELDDVEVTSTPTLSANPQTTTVFDADGNPVQVKETNIWYDFDVRDNPSPAPTLDLNTNEETKTYEDGVLTGTTSTTGTASGGAGGAGSDIQIEVPTDCDFMPTVCAFLDWFKDDDTPEDPDLSVLLDDRDFTETYTVTGGSKQCPPDYEFTVELVGRTYGLSFEPACDFASKMYYFVMAAAYIFAAYITVGAARHG